MMTVQQRHTPSILSRSSWWCGVGPVLSPSTHNCSEEKCKLLHTIHPSWYRGVHHTTHPGCCQRVPPSPSSFFQSVCTLGYCLLPLAVALLVSRLLLLDSHHTRLIFALRLSIIGVALVWAVWGEQPPGTLAERGHRPSELHPGPLLGLHVAGGGWYSDLRPVTLHKIPLPASLYIPCMTSKTC